MNGRYVRIFTVECFADPMKTGVFQLISTLLHNAPIGQCVSDSGEETMYAPDMSVETTRNVHHEGLMDDHRELGANIGIHVVHNILEWCEPVINVLMNVSTLTLYDWFPGSPRVTTLFSPK